MTPAQAGPAMADLAIVDHDIVESRARSAAARSQGTQVPNVDELKAQLNALNVQIQTLMDRL